MQNKPIFTLLLCTAFTVIGLIGGYLASSPQSKSTSQEENHSDDKHGDEELSVLSVQALKNLKVKSKEIETSSYTTFRSITARIEATPKTAQPVLAPIGGIIKSINVEHGEMVSKGVVLMTLMRDSIPRPELKITGDLLSMEQRLIGLTAKDITNLNSKPNSEKQSYLWKNVLTKNGYWNEKAETVLNHLPEDIKRIPFSIAIIGEMSANGYLDQELVDWMTKDKLAQTNFFNITSLLLEGKSYSFVKYLMRIGAFNSLVTIKAPDLAPDFDVHEIQVKVGDKVEMGQVLGVLHNMRELHVEAYARGSEIKILMDALEKNLEISAVPLAKGSGMELKGLKIRSIQDDSERDGAKIHLQIYKNPFIIREGRSNKKYRSWKIRIGSRYMIRVPRHEYKDVFVVPSLSVVEDGAERIVFIEDGDTYKPAKVVVLFQNNEVAVLGKGSDLFPGDPVVIRGAFGLGLALKAQTGGAVDAHAGHSH